MICKTVDNRVIVREMSKDRTTGGYEDIPCYGTLALLPATCLGKLRVHAGMIRDLPVRTLRCNQCNNALAIIGESLNAREAALRAEEQEGITE